MTLAPFTEVEAVADRLPVVFPEGIPNRNYCIRRLSASTVFVALYIGAIEGTDVYFGPAHVYRMSDVQSTIDSDVERQAYGKNIFKKNYVVKGNRWYADNTREPIRDETLRDGLVAIGAVIARDDLPTTSSAPRYQLKREFAALFDPKLSGPELLEAVESYQKAHLTKSALARVSIMRAGAIGSESSVGVKFPSGETRQLAPGPSSAIAKNVIEVFAGKFLEKPAVLWLSESGNKVVVQDDKLANALGLKIEADKNLPDLILADLGPAEPLFVFVEFVATDGAVTSRRQEAIFELTDAAGFQRSQVAFVTAYEDRASAGFKKTVSALAWGSFAWFMSEPEGILIMRNGLASKGRLLDLIV